MNTEQIKDVEIVKEQQAGSLLYKMQADCYTFTQTLKNAQKILGVELSDEELKEWLGDGLFIFLDKLFKNATGQRPNSNYIGRGVFQQEPLTEYHLSVLEKEHGLDRGLYETTIEGLLNMHYTNYFEPKIFAGHVFIDQCEFNGTGVTGIVAKKEFETSPF